MSQYATPQPYAPTPYLPRPLAPPNINLDAEVKLWSTTAQRELYESLAELHAIIVALEHLEKAFVRDSVPAPAYTATCLRLLGQYRTLLGNASVAAAFGDLAAFRARYDVDCPAAARRLETGLPATAEHPSADTPAAAPAVGAGRWDNVSPKAAAEATGNLITFMDALKLEYRAKDELHPLLAKVITSVDAVTGVLFTWVLFAFVNCTSRKRP